MDKTENNEIVDGIGQEESMDISFWSKLNALDVISGNADIKSKIAQFSNYLLGIGRIQLLYTNKSDNEQIIFSLLNLKKQLKYILTDLGKSRNQKNYTFSCPICDKKIIVHQTNFWEGIQDHEHFEEMYCQFLKEGVSFYQQHNDSQNVNIEEVAVEFSSHDISIKNYNDCKVDTEQPYVTYGLNDSELLEQVDEKNVNSFRFNFIPSYYEAVQSTCYPAKTIYALRKFDPTEYPTVIAVGPSRAACLICHCDLVSRTKNKMGRQFFLEHISGNRHMKQALIIENINALINFHEIWLTQEPLIQAHQVYFRPEYEDCVQCVLCMKIVSSRAVESHIFTKYHKSRVIDNYQKNRNSFYLLNLQLKLYGIELESDDSERKTVSVSPTKSKEKNKAISAKNERKSNNTSNKLEKQEDSPHNIIKSIENPLSKVLIELLPHRYQRHLQVFNNHGSSVTCKVCNIRISGSIYQVIFHILSENHLKLSKIPLVAYTYYCEICNLRISNEFIWIDHFELDSKQHKKSPESRRQMTAEYECTKCCTVIYGDELSLSRHLYTKGVRQKAKEIKLCKSVLNIFKSRESIELEAAKFVSEANKTLECNDATMECCKRVEHILTSTFEGCKAYPFGSRISGLGDQKSDLDLFLDIGDMYTGYNNQDSLSQIQIVRKVHSAMCKVKEEFHNVVQIPTARTPIVKFHHNLTDIDCDLSFRHGLSVENTKFLRFCFDTQPKAQSFILILKFWSHQNDLAEYITTYALAIMAIFYLQTKGYLFSVKRLRELSPSKGLTIAGWETVSYKLFHDEVKQYIVPYSGSVVEFLKEFFLYYSKFSYDVEVVCPLLGKCIKKKDFDNNGKNLPPEMNSYRAQLKCKEPEHFRNTTPMCVQDPFDLSHNLTKALRIDKLKAFTTLCEMSYKTIESL